MSPNQPMATGNEIFERYTVLTIRDLSRMCTVEPQDILALVEEGILQPLTEAAGEWQFAGEALRRARLALRLQRDLEVNLAGVALALELLEEIHQLRRAIRRAGDEL
jgi:chaperone modulatory protein CbpM